MSEGPPRVRCAIYTRKSTENAWAQDFNSLQALWIPGDGDRHSELMSIMIPN
jgi:hypothetical protein